MMKYFTLYQTYTQLKIEQLMYTTNSSIQWLQLIFPCTGAMYSSLKNDLRRWREIRVTGPANFRQIERSCVWPESPRTLTINVAHLSTIAWISISLPFLSHKTLLEIKSSQHAKAAPYLELKFESSQRRSLKT